MMENVLTLDTIHQQLIFARFRQVPNGYYEADTSVTDLKLRPVRMHEIHWHGPLVKEYTMAFNPAEVNVDIKKGKTSTHTRYPMPSGYFEDNMVDYVFSYLNLKKGKTYKLENFNEARKGPDPYTLSYAFDDLYQATDGKVNCIVLHYMHGLTEGYIWIDKNKHEI